MMVVLLPISPEELKVLAALLCVLIATAFAAKLLMPITQALGRRLGAKAGDEGVRTELEDLRARVVDLEVREGRMLEMEERLDFAERLLARTLERSLEDSDTPPEALPAPR